MIYGKQSAQIDDAHGAVRLTATHDPVSIKQGSDLIRLTRPAARELAADIVACLDELEAGTRTPDVEWTPGRRAILRRALAKVSASVEKRELAHMQGDESAAMFKAAEAWAGMMDMLDQEAEAGRLPGLKE